jgi:hypothetical protein
MGAMVPFILRNTPIKLEYKLVGETYLHGFMHGEMLTSDFTSKVGTLKIV